MGEGDGSGVLVGIAVGMFVMATIFESKTEGVGVGGSGKGVGLAGTCMSDSANNSAGFPGAAAVGKMGTPSPRSPSACIGSGIRAT